MSEDPEIKEYYRHECNCCFLRFEDEIEQASLCYVCRSDPEFIHNKRVRIERILSVLDKTLISRYPQILRLIWDELK